MTNSKEFLRRNVLIPLYLVSLEFGIQLGMIFGLVGNVSQAGIILEPADRAIAKLPSTFSFFSLLLYPSDYIRLDGATEQ
jgi:hypothetical protein